MSGEAITLTIVTSALVSSLVAFLLRILFENRQQHRFDTEIERLKHTYDVQMELLRAEMTVKSEIQREATERRLQNYPKLAELVYRIRNLCREIATAGASPVLVDEFAARSKELTDLLYTSRIDLDRDELFADMHDYKTLLGTFHRALVEIDFLQSAGTQPDKVERARQLLHSTYASIEALHKPLIDEMSARVSATDPHATSDDARASTLQLASP